MSKKYVNFDEDNTLSKYFKEVKKSVILTPDEELILAKRIQSGDNEAIEKLVNANLKFVISIAKDYQNQGLPLSDIISEGNYGLVKAATRFDHTRGFRFISYAVWWIKQSIIQSLNENARIVRLPANVIFKLGQLKRDIEKFEFENEHEPVFGEILNEAGEPVELIMYPTCASLNDVINDDGDELIDLICVDDNETDKLFIDDKIKEKINETLSILDNRERDIIQCYFGINTDCEPMTLEAIGEKYNLTKERIRQIKSRSLKKIRYNSLSLYNILNG